jgi:carboxyl-terminal processing protease
MKRLNFYTSIKSLNFLYAENKKRYIVKIMLKTRLYLLFFFLSCSLFLEAGQLLPQIDAKGVQAKISEILEAHAQYKKMEPVLIKRSLKEFINELDPTKTYFYDSEIIQWTEPNDELVSKILIEFNKGNYAVYEEIFNIAITSIKRRNLFEEEIQNNELPKDVQISEFKDPAWAKTEDELKNRLVRIKALQFEAADKLTEESKDVIMQRILKRRLKREADFLKEDPKEKQYFVYSLILKAVSSSLDSHTSYFTPSEAEQFLIQVQQRLFGLGVQIRDDLNGFTVVKIIEGGPAASNKNLKVNDKIIAVNGEFVVGYDVAEVVELIRGESQTPVALTVLREEEALTKNAEKIDLIINRGEVILQDTRFESSLDPFGDGYIGHIKLFSFYQDPQSSSAQDIAKTLTEWKKKYKLKGLVLDLRNNSGGLLPQAVAVTGLFITKGVVVSVKNSDGTVQRLRDLDGKMAWSGPLVVLTNRLSASAAEIVTQTLQDYGRAIIVGDDHTFGKGTFQTFTLDTSGKAKVNNQGEYKVTRGKYYTVSGKSPQLTGALADITIPGPFHAQEIGEKFTAYPLENDSIDPLFDDDLADVPGLQHEQIAWLYRSKIQERLTTYTTHLDLLKKNADSRIANNKMYQKFLEEVKKPNIDTEALQTYEGQDFQYEESLNILKDLIIVLPVAA